MEELSISDPGSILTTGILKTVVLKSNGLAANAVTRNEQKSEDVRVFSEDSVSLV